MGSIFRWILHRIRPLQSSSHWCDACNVIRGLVPGLVPRIHVFCGNEDVDGRAKPGQARP
jgi:hypothetical protein